MKQYRSCRKENLRAKTGLINRANKAVAEVNLILIERESSVNGDYRRRIIGVRMYDEVQEERLCSTKDQLLLDDERDGLPKTTGAHNVHRVFERGYDLFNWT